MRPGLRREGFTMQQLNRSTVMSGISKGDVVTVLDLFGNTVSGTVAYVTGAYGPRMALIDVTNDGKRRFETVRVENLVAVHGVRVPGEAHAPVDQRHRPDALVPYSNPMDSMHEIDAMLWRVANPSKYTVIKR
jgi:hypothetical protein